MAIWHPKRDDCTFSRISCELINGLATNLNYLVESKKRNIPISDQELYKLLEEMRENIQDAQLDLEYLPYDDFTVKS